MGVEEGVKHWAFLLYMWKYPRGITVNNDQKMNGGLKYIPQRRYRGGRERKKAINKLYEF